MRTCAWTHAIAQAHKPLAIFGRRARTCRNRPPLPTVHARRLHDFLKHWHTQAHGGVEPGVGPSLCFGVLSAFAGQVMAFPLETVARRLQVRLSCASAVCLCLCVYVRGCACVCVFVGHFLRGRLQWLRVFLT